MARPALADGTIGQSSSSAFQRYLGHLLTPIWRGAAAPQVMRLVSHRSPQSDPYHFQVSVARSHDTRLVPPPKVCMCTTVLCCAGRACADAQLPQGLAPSPPGTRLLADLQRRCAHALLPKLTAHRHFRHIIARTAHACTADGYASCGSQGSLSGMLWLRLVMCSC